MNGQPPGRGPQGEEPSSPRGVLIGLVLILLLVIGGVYLVNKLRDSARLQDCQMQGRTNCAPNDTGR